MVSEAQISVSDRIFPKVGGSKGLSSGDSNGYSEIETVGIFPYGTTPKFAYHRNEAIRN